MLEAGAYWCSTDPDDLQILSLITVSSQPRSNRLPGANVTLSCSLVTYQGPDQRFSSLYRGLSLKWQDDNRPDNMLAGQSGTECEVWLRVNIQPGSRFSCLALVKHQVQSRVEFPVRIRDWGGVNNSQLIISVAVVGCAMMVVLALIVVWKKKKRKPNDQLVACPETPLHVNTGINTDGAATAEDVTYADLTLAGMADRKWETENEDTVYAGIQPIGRDNV
ncbi:uncharacterized protein LOC115534768 isoform X3 [Gadus morhua]|uniref:uncharacterized protein LOC115534768 isoform X3 n=1 Tax=Gadus morhua TaxID=8049 RepID=UPI0011B72683|nr:uncharacterized protein LOC115534768 isoform X3 [Gadus morhua]